MLPFASLYKDSASALVPCLIRSEHFTLIGSGALGLYGCNCRDTSKIPHAPSVDFCVDPNS